MQGAVEGGDEAVDLGEFVIQAERHTDRAGDSQEVDERLRAVVTDTDSYTLLVEQRTDIERMDELTCSIIDIERQHTGFRLPCGIDTHTRDLHELLLGILGELLLVGSDSVASALQDILRSDT